MWETVALGISVGRGKGGGDLEYAIKLHDFLYMHVRPEQHPKWGFVKYRQQCMV